ncbi:MAG: efflux transporter outer membrane subunit [bacterium]|nr:efflux transporter outer membrane subunit [bacterium]
MSRLVPILVLALACAGCALRAPDVAVPAPPLPAAFDGDTGGVSAARTTWRDWLGDDDLAALVAEALASNQDLHIALQRIETARAAVRAATGALLPQVGLNVGAGIQKFGLYTMDGAGNRGTEIAPGRLIPVRLPDFTLGLEASWEVDLWGRLRSQREAALARHLASVDGTNLVLSALVADVASAYFDLLALDQIVAVLHTSASQQAEALEIVRLQKEAGRANELAVQQFEAQVADTQARERDVVQQVVETENRINVLLGRYPQPVPRKRELLFADPPAPLSTGVPSDLLRNRPDVRAAELAVRASELDVQAARAAFFPTLTITAGAGWDAFNTAFLFRTPESLAWSAAGGLVAPLVNRLALEAQFIGARANQIEALYEYQRTLLVAFTEVVNALSNVRQSDELLASRRRQKAALEQSIDTADALYRAGKATYLEVLLAQENALQADVDLAEAFRRRRVANVAVYKALGGGWR